jgi:hypothetical protein
VVTEGDPAMNGQEQRKADVAAFEAYGFDGRTDDGVPYELFGIQARDGEREVIRGEYQALPAQTDGRVPLTITLSARADDLTVERAAELIRNVYFHHFTAHYYCARIGEIIVVDNGEKQSVPFDEC